jgi:subtilase family serine protease
MRPKYLVFALIVLVLALLPFLPARVSGQTGSVPSRISAAVDNTKLTMLRGNTHPMARAEFDRGAAPASLPMDHMLLVLTRSPQQEAALETLLAQQQDRTSPNYHKWLTPQQFGQQFGPSDQDIQTITSWLQSNGFQINNVATGRTTIDFSGTAGAVQQAFHTAIHSYVLANGEQHWANSTDPQIPVALAPVVAGVNSMNNFRRRSMSHSVGVFRRTKADGKVTRISPQFTFAPPGGGCNSNGNCYAVTPGDFAKIYNVPSSVTGTGQVIAIVSDSDINATDVANFRSIFSLPAANFQQIETAPASDPGIQASGDEGEAVLDVEWSGAVAPGAKIDLVVSPSTNTTFGGDTSAQYIINNSNNLGATILGYSYGACELDLGTAGNAFYQGLWSQAQALGITVVVATGDNGSAACENPNPNDLATAQPATTGLAVNGISSTPYNIAVGGTDFNDAFNPATYWSSTNSGTGASIISYIPEIAYNDSCTNAILDGVSGLSSVAETNCNNASLIDYGGQNFIVSFGGGGGPSNCTTSSTTATTLGPVSSCGGGYAKPTWQTGPGVPADGKRDTPDVSFFAGDGTIQNFYIVCQSDQVGNAGCNLNSPFQDFVGVGGTSVSTEAFAGVVALINQKNGATKGSGNLNPTLYALATEQNDANCNASGTPASSCIFNDVTSGTIAMPCAKGSPNCTVNSSSDTIGILSGYSAGTGYDLATGLGSINIGNLVNNSGPNFYLSSSSPVVTISSPGASGTMTFTAYPVNGYAGTVNLACSNLPPAATCSFSPASVVFTSSTSSTTGIPVTVTVNTTTASRLIPSVHPWNMINWVAASLVSFAAVILLSMLFVAGPQRRQFGWSLAGLLLALSLVAGLVACGGGSSTTTPSSSSTTTNNGTTGNFSSVLTGTASSGSPVSSMNFTVTVQ